MNWFEACPQPPHWQIAWAPLETHPLWQALRGCPQDPNHHAEGDVWNHVHAVVEALVSLQSWRDLPQDEREIVFAVACLHDVGKPATTKTEPDGRISSRGHSRVGTILARNDLWEQRCPFARREAICNLIQTHMRPFYWLEQHRPNRETILLSQLVCCEHLAILAEADARGRISESKNQLLEIVALFAESLSDLDCRRKPFAFPNDTSRLAYAADPNASELIHRFESFGSQVILLSGFPGVGKDTWLRQQHPNLPVVSLDEIRASFGISPEDDQGAVIQQGREAARAYLRQGQDFAWNATNLSARIRGETVRLLLDYHAQVRIVYLEVPLTRLAEQNRSRKARVPDSVMLRLRDRWEVPTCLEAHQLEMHIHE
ncbi:ATP-binding protein [Tuwongella immobilis]|uniref:HD domain-containing protein n=1 Tax=Tuwongella immobilis TaxID=692036 RepID=A0A6C2YPQ1_9BACT|nr:ATP-binding protein [Tuwongella immobilis]VIP03600.1 Uncharacterized protein OS=[Oscillatoria] sp. PCC 6506 GN=OSCI_2310013 PE=4 SV=1: HD: AAA_33 [Tuwongella immobilis]VTS04568.1 Uncharacterized protein OS=[Oscillatoria] sp. PCC 6506 GN=OSCI_2310013 PE=4 SV=1: HD: AAA_33 [Tuwongella immobilis]